MPRNARRMLVDVIIAIQNLGHLPCLPLQEYTCFVYVLSNGNMVQSFLTPLACNRRRSFAASRSASAPRHVDLLLPRA